MTAPRRRADRLFDASYLDSLKSRPILELREMREECDEFEVEVSYARRLLQGKLDILKHEVERRRAGGESGVESLIEKLPSILADEERPAGFGRATRILTPSGADRRRREIERLASEDTLAHLDDLPTEKLSEVIDRLAETEAKVSQERRQVLELIDRITSEMVRRYVEGEEDPSAILTSER